MKVSIVICAYLSSSYDNLTTLLDSIKEQTSRSMEVIVVIDENMTLYEKLSEFICARNYGSYTKVIFNAINKGLSNGRNLGIENSSGDIVAFIDDDAYPEKNWIEAIQNIFTENLSIGGIVGKVVPLWEKPEMAWFPHELYWMVSCSYVMTPTSRQEVERGFGANMAFRRDLLIQAGLFNTNLGICKNRWIGGEDSDMFLKIKTGGNKVIYDPGVLVYHKIAAKRIKLKSVIVRAFNGGLSVCALKKGRQYRIMDSSENRYLNQLLFSFYPRVIRSSITNFSFIPIKQMLFVTLVILFEGVGYLYGMIDVGKLSNIQTENTVDDV